MPTNCIIKSKAEELKKAFRNRDISFKSLYNLKSSEARIKVLEKYVGESAKMLNASIEKTFLSPNQKLAMRNWVYKNIGGGKPLYKGISLEQAQKMSDNLSMVELKKMSSRDRIAELFKYVDNAEQLNKRFESLLKTGNLANWEERTMGTKQLRENKKLKGALSRLEFLNDLGVLNPNQMEDFMQSFVETELGVDLSLEESQKLSTLVKKQSDAFDRVFESNDWTYKNEKQVTDYLVSVKELREYTESLMPSTIKGTLNKLIGYARSSILASPRIARNSALYQMIPTIERAVAKRLISGNIGDLKSSFVERVQAKLSGSKPTKQMAEFITKQTLMATKIYHKTGFDISRMQTLDDGYTFFGGEKFKPLYGKKMSEAKTTKEKIQVGLNNWAKFINLAPKWFAGGTDMLAANMQRADTAILMSKEIASLESKKGKLPDGVTKEQRAEQLLTESYSFNPTDIKAQQIRDAGIMDAHMSNNTQPDGAADLVLKLRGAFKIGGIDFGKVLVPFAKIATTTISRGTKTVTGYGAIKSIYQIYQASKITDVNERSKKIYEITSNLVGYVGIMGAAILLGTFLDDDDYVGGYDSLSFKEYGLARTRGSSPGYVRIGGKWIPLRYLPMINIPLSAIMTARQARLKGKRYLDGYITGILGGILETPLISDVFDILKDVGKSAQSKEFINALGLDGENITNWAKVRAIPSLVSYDLYKIMFPSEAKYDFLGREIEGGIFKDDKSNEITVEFNRLNNEGKMPVISDPKGEYTIEELNKYKQKYAEKVIKLLKKDFYSKKDAEEQKKLIDNIRTTQILNKLN